MKKLLLFTSSLLLLAACGDERSTEEEQSNDDIEITEAIENDGDKENEETSAKNHTEQNNDASENETKTAEPELYDPENIFVKEGEQELKGKYAKVKENLKLPYFYENTKVYSGTINPEQTVSFELAEKEGGGTQTIQPEISEDGQFTLALFNSALNKEDNVQMVIKGDMPENLAFELPIQVETEGMEIVPKDEKAERNIKAVTKLPDFYSNTNSYYGKTIPNAEVTVIEPRGQQLKMHANEEGDFSGEFANFPYVAQGEANLSEGDRLIFLIRNENGSSTYLKVNVLAPADEPNYTEPIRP